MQRVDKYVIQNINRKNIINIIRNDSPINRAQIAKMTGLSIPAVMKITEDFIASGLVREIGKGESTGGKPPALLSFVPDYRHIIGVDVGTTNILVILMDLSARVICRRTVRTPRDRKFERILQAVADLIGEVMRQTGTDAGHLLGIGVGAPGLIAPDTGVVLFSPDMGWQDADFFTPLSERFGCPVMIGNVTRAMAMGELWFGQGHDAGDFLCVNLGYGIGSAIVIDHKLYGGLNGMSGEFGHMTLDKNGPLCDCGNYGCLEALSSANAISKQARSAIGAGAQSIIRDMVDGDLGRIEAKTVFDAAKAGDALASTIVNQAVEYLGIAIGGVINLLAPRLIILEGGVSRAGESLLNPLEKAIAAHVMPFRGAQTGIVISGLGTDAAAVGAASFLFNELVEQGGEIQKSATRITL